MSSFTKIEIDGVKAAPDRIYYNGTVINNTLTSTKSLDDPPLKFQDARENPIVPDASKYEVSVQNFSLNGVSKTLPLFIPQINPKTLNLSVNFVEAVQIPIPNTNPQAYQPILNVTYTLASPYALYVGDYIDSVTTTLGGPYDFGPTTRTPGPLMITAVTPTTFTVQFSCFPGTASIGAVASLKNPADVNTTVYEVSVGIYDGSTYAISTAPVIWSPDNQASYTPVPETALPTQEESEYYYCYTYSHMVQLINNALFVAWDAAKGTAGTQCPFLEFDETTGLFSLNQDALTSMTPFGSSLPQPYNSTASVTGSASGGTYVTGEYSFVGWNTCLDQLLSNFPSVYYGLNKVWASSVTQFLPEVVVDTGLTIDLTTGSSGTDSPIGLTLKTKPTLSTFQLFNPFAGTGITNAYFSRLTQDFKSTGGTWSPIASFVLVTTQIQVRNEFNANPVTFGSGNVGSGAANSGSFQKVLIETPINSVSADIWRGWVLYEPLVPTFSSLDPSQEGVKDVDVALYWRNRLTNSLVPVYIPNQGSMSFRLLFKKKLVL